jgi:hypothetical protein
MPDDQLQFKQFKALSAGLTGLDLPKLSPGVDTIGIAAQYWDAVKTNLDPKFRPHLDEMLDNVTVTPMLPASKKLVEQLLADEKFGPIARSILKLWMLGAWYPPATPKKAKMIVSSQAYKESLAWKAMQAHPMGYSMLPFGHWSAEPESLKQFLTFAPSKEFKHA